MKQLLITTVCFLASALLYGQTPTDPKIELKKLTDDLAHQLKGQGDKKIAVASFV